MAHPFSTFALCTLLSASGIFPFSRAVAQEPTDTPIEVQEKARRTMAIRDALQQVQEARLAYEAKRYTEAVEHYRNALSVLPKAPATQKQEKFIRDSLSDALIARAIDYRSVGRTEDALEFLREAITLSPDNQRAKIELSYTEDPVRTNPALRPEHVGDVEEVSRLLTLGYGYLDLGKYDEALRTFQAVAQYDKYNEAARRGIERVNQYRASYYRAAYDARRSAMMAEVDAAWDIKPEDEAAPGVPMETDTAISSDEVTDESLAHASLLDEIRVPDLVMEHTSVEEVIEILTNIIRRHEARSHKTARSINITTDFGERGTDAYNAIMQKRISLELHDISLKEALTEIARHFDLEYYIIPSGIELAAGESSQRIVSRTFTGVGPHVFDTETEEDDSEEEADEDDLSVASSRVRVTRMDPKRFFKKQGVTFPRGSRVNYYPNGRRLEVSNTRHNLEKIASILNNSGTKEWNVVLNIMMVETTEENLEDLGFDWLFQVGFGQEVNMAGGMEQAYSSALGLPLLSTQRRVSKREAPVATQGLRSINTSSGAKDMNKLIELGSIRNYSEYDTGDAVSPTVFGMRGVWTAADVTMIMRGLSQKKDVDTLYNPRLILDPNNEEGVSFTNVREMYIPQSYDPPEIYQQTFRLAETDDGIDLDGDGSIVGWSYSGAVAIAVGAQPTDFERYGADDEKMDGIGAIVRVHKAEPTADGRQVRMAITTVINDFEGFIDWGSPIYAVMWTPTGGSNEIDRVFLSPNHIYQPIFKRYMTNTNITIANGAVLVMGGLREARVVRYEDKVPILGDLPLVGRLFRSEGEDRRRRALLIFAKVDIVDPTGRDVVSGEKDVATQSPM